MDCKNVGNGDKVLIYLGQYFYKGVVQEKDILKSEKSMITFRYFDETCMFKIWRFTQKHPGKIGKLRLKIEIDPNCDAPSGLLPDFGKHSKKISSLL